MIEPGGIFLAATCNHEPGAAQLWVSVRSRAVDVQVDEASRTAEEVVLTVNLYGSAQSQRDEMCLKDLEAGTTFWSVSCSCSAQRTCGSLAPC